MTRSATKPLIVLFLLLGIIVLAACRSTQATNAASKCKIGFITENQQDIFFTLTVKGAQQAAKKVHCDLSVVNPDNDASRQSEEIQTLITQGVDGIIIDPIDVHGILPAVDAARKGGTPVVAAGQDLGAAHQETYVGTDNGAAAENFGRYMAKKGLAAGKSYGVIDARNSFTQSVREDRFRKIIDKAGAKFVQSVSGENQNEKAVTAAQNLLTAHPNLDYVYTTGTPATFGAVTALKNKQNGPMIVGWDLSKEIINGIEDGTVLATVQQHPEDEGAQAVTEMKRIIDKKAPRKRIGLSTTIVTKTNVDQYRNIYS